MDTHFFLLGFMYQPNRNSFQQKIVQGKADYSAFNTKGNLGNPKGSSFQFAPTNSAYNSPVYLSHDLPVKFSDEHIFNENTRKISQKMLRKRKLWISDKNKDNSSNNPEDFAVELQERFNEVRSIKVVQVYADYTFADATETVIGSVHFPDFSHSERSTNGQNYHAIFPITQGTDGNSVKFGYSFTDTYISDFKSLTKLDRRLRVQVFYENTSGSFVPFTSLNRFGVELEVTTFEFSENDNLSVVS